MSVATLPFSSSTDQEITELLKKYQIALTLDEAKKIAELLGRDPTVTEAVIWGIQGSEHCSYKSSRRFLRQFLTDGPNIILGPVEDSGIVAITDEPDGKRWGLAITHESHNHPSQIVPYEGAATGVGGTVRDVLCMGARVIGCMDMLRLGDLKTEETRSIASEVMRGIAGYGNPLGVPNLGGDTVFDSSYNSNCLVNAIALGIVREDEVIHSICPEEAAEVGYDIILFGKPTDRSGFGGAAFASGNLDEDDREQNTGAVQEPNPFLERHLLASSYALFDWLAQTNNLNRVSCKDLGAGGVICATVEQVAERGYGAEVNLDNVHTALDGLPAEVIACAETQERLCFTCHPDLTDHIIRHYNEVWDLPSVAENARASLVGKVTGDGVYTATFQGEVVCQAKATDITEGLKYERPLEEVEYNGSEPEIESDTQGATIDGKSFSYTEIVKALLSHPNHGSPLRVIKHYDKNVIGNTCLEPGEGDAGVIQPLQDLQSYTFSGEHPGWNLSEDESKKGVAFAADGNNRYGRISPYWQGLNATIESMRNVATVGATPRAITDCLNYGNPEIPSQLWALAEGVRGIAEASKEVLDGVPVISGNVSLYNSTPDGSAIDPSAVVSCTGIIPDATKCVSMQLKEAGSTLLFLGSRKDECGGSAYYEILENLCNAVRDAYLGTNVPKPDFGDVTKEIKCMVECISAGHILASHDVSAGGLLLALFEMTLPQRKVDNQLGIDIDLSQFDSDLPIDKLLFSETGGFIVECTPEQVSEVQNIAQKHNVPVTTLGTVTDDHVLKISHGEAVVLEEGIGDLREVHGKALDSF